MKYLRILSAYAAEPLAIQPEKLAAITEFLLFKADGGSFTDEELAARTSGRRSDAPASTAPGVAIIPVHGVLANRMDMMTEISGGSSYQGINSHFPVRTLTSGFTRIEGGLPALDDITVKLRFAPGPSQGWQQTLSETIGTPRAR